MAAINEFIFTWLDPIGIVVGLLLAIPVLWTWYEVTLGQKKRLRRQQARAIKQPGQQPAVLIIDLNTNGQVETAVKKHLSKNAALKDIPADRIYRLCRDTAISPKDMADLRQHIRKLASTMMTAGVDTVHFFYSGPVVVPPMVGAIFSNSHALMLYQYDRDSGDYINFGPALLPAGSGK